MIEKTETIRNKAHLEFIRTLPCLWKGYYPSEAAHIRKGTDGGMGKKPSDSFVVPLHRDSHYHQHSVGEVTFYNGEIYRAIELANALYENTGDTQKCLNLLARARLDIWQ